MTGLRSGELRALYEEARMQMHNVQYAYYQNPCSQKLRNTMAELTDTMNQRFEAWQAAERELAEQSYARTGERL
jgi:hypothetical protein